MTIQELIEICTKMEFEYGFSGRLLDISENNKEDVEKMIQVIQKVFPSYKFTIEDDYLRIIKIDF